MKKSLGFSVSLNSKVMAFMFGILIASFIVEIDWFQHIFWLVTGAFAQSFKWNNKEVSTNE